MDKKTILKTAYGMPIASPAFNRPPLQFYRREILNITYKTDIDLLRKFVPEPLEVIEPLVKFQVIKMPDVPGCGTFFESEQLITVHYKGQIGTYMHLLLVPNMAALAFGREMFGYAKKVGYPELKVDGDTLVGTIHYGNERIAMATMGYKFKRLDKEEVKKSYYSPIFTLKIIPAPDDTLAICQLVKIVETDIVIHEAWSAPAALHIIPHALAPLHLLPVHEIVSAQHIICDLTINTGEVVCDYLK
ncbi:MAG: acetoacetate decarboxylase [Bacteroidia bacterium]